MTAPLLIPGRMALRGALAAAEAEAAALAADPPEESVDALYEAVSDLAGALRLITTGHRHSARLMFEGDEGLELARAASEAFPLESPESDALFTLLAAIEQRAGINRNTTEVAAR
jgi:hypothetical protein